MTKEEIKRRLIEILCRTTPLEKEREKFRKMNIEQILRRIDGYVLDGKTEYL